MNKINSNVARDENVDILSSKKGWKVLRIRECKLKNEKDSVIKDLNNILML